jgi:hypothetical protein
MLCGVEGSQDDRKEQSETGVKNVWLTGYSIMKGMKLSRRLNATKYTRAISRVIME